MRFWLLVGDEENWERASAENIWGVTGVHRKTWERLESGDVALFMSRDLSRGL